jgi:hypothetical protein
MIDVRTATRLTALTAIGCVRDSAGRRSDGSRLADPLRDRNGHELKGPVFEEGAADPAGPVSMPTRRSTTCTRGHYA